MNSINQKKNKNNYLYKFIKKYKNTNSGRKNYEDFENRVIKNILLTKNFINLRDIKRFMQIKKTFKILKKSIKIIYK